MYLFNRVPQRTAKSQNESRLGHNYLYWKSRSRKLENLILGRCRFGCPAISQYLKNTLPAGTTPEILLFNRLFGLHRRVKRCLGAKFLDEPMRFLPGET